MNQQIAISGLGGQGVLFITRLLAETAMELGLDVLSSETHGMAMRGGAVISHLKVGRFDSPLIRSGQADLAIFLADENLTVHPQLIGVKTRVLVDSARGQDSYESIDAGGIAQGELGRRQSANLVVVGYALGKGYLFSPTESVLNTLNRLSPRQSVFEANEKALKAGLSHAVS
jgi:indolepyruvate ferredoxin oxidoreductase beta subunit